MLVTTKIKLIPTKEQFETLKFTMEKFNLACNAISKIAFDNKCFSKIKLQKICYYSIREQFKMLSSQLVIRAIAKVCEAYKSNKKSLCEFRLDGSIVYDQRILSLKGIEFASLSTAKGRIEIAMLVSDYHLSVMQDKRIRGQADLVLIDGTFYLFLVIELPDGAKINSTDVLGVDLGIVNIASDSEGEFFNGAKVNSLRKRYARIRAKLQKKGTKSAKRKLKKRSQKEKRMVKDINHCISKKIVEKAIRHSSVISLEDLKGISKKKQKSETVKKAQRQRFNNWSFYQLRKFIEYKAQKAGVEVLFVNPKYTSQKCSDCGHTTKENRKTQNYFECIQCGFVANADYNASLNIKEKGYHQLAKRMGV